ncbi:MAG: PorT family protein [Bacteroides sp.]|nr:PorT family protein [Bacteroides sp.]MCM1378504.1 PorT family protein [Bacteroides sp.]MCM1444805.1 PorT family protein [Prevotella sp.]
MRNRILFVLLCAVALLSADGKQLNDKLLNRPYADLKAWHLGFSVGLHMQDLQLTNNGYSADGQQWFAEQPAFNPGFCVNGLIDFRLHTHFNVRLAPGIWFGNKVLEFRDALSGATERQNIKSTILVLPIDLKISSLRYRNVRPYLTAGVMPTFDVGKRRNDELIHLKKFDTFVTVGLGLDTYFPYFKFIPEVKFCFGLSNLLERKREDLADTPERMIFTNSLDRAVSRMIVLTFYFE